MPQYNNSRMLSIECKGDSRIILLFIKRITHLPALKKGMAKNAFSCYKNNSRGSAGWQDWSFQVHKEK